LFSCAVTAFCGFCCGCDILGYCLLILCWCSRLSLLILVCLSRLFILICLIYCRSIFSSSYIILLSLIFLTNLVHYLWLLLVWSLLTILFSLRGCIILALILNILIRNISLVLSGWSVIRCLVIRTQILLLFRFSFTNSYLCKINTTWLILICWTVYIWWVSWV
jgi:hypothetical protein